MRRPYRLPKDVLSGGVGVLHLCDQVAASGGSMKAVEGLGERAGMFNGTPQNGLPSHVIILYVVKGKSFITIGLSGMKDENAALEKAKRIAEKILAQL